MRAGRQLGVHQAFTSYNNPKGNADTERVIRTMKEELLWLKEWTSPHQLKRELSLWVESYNPNYLHSALGYRTPVWFKKTIRTAKLLSCRPPDKWGAVHRVFGGPP